MPIISEKLICRLRLSTLSFIKWSRRRVERFKVWPSQSRIGHNGIRRPNATMR